MGATSTMFHCLVCVLLAFFAGAYASEQPLVNHASIPGRSLLAKDVFGDFVTNDTDCVDLLVRLSTKTNAKDIVFYIMSQDGYEWYSLEQDEAEDHIKDNTVYESPVCWAAGRYTLYMDTAWKDDMYNEKLQQSWNGALLEIGQVKILEKGGKTLDKKNLLVSATLEGVAMEKDDSSAIRVFSVSDEDHPLPKDDSSDTEPVDHTITRYSAAGKDCACEWAPTTWTEGVPAAGAGKPIIGLEYTGEEWETAAGLECQGWWSMFPNSHTFTPQAYPGKHLDDGYYGTCRNPDGDAKAWCFTITEQRWDYCDLPVCTPALCRRYGCLGILLDVAGVATNLAWDIVNFDLDVPILPVVSDELVVHLNSLNGREIQSALEKLEVTGSTFNVKWDEAKEKLCRVMADGSESCSAVQWASIVASSENSTYTPNEKFSLYQCLGKGTFVVRMRNLGTGTGWDGANLALVDPSGKQLVSDLKVPNGANSAVVGLSLQYVCAPCTEVASLLVQYIGSAVVHVRVLHQDTMPPPPPPARAPPPPGEGESEDDDTGPDTLFNGMMRPYKVFKVLPFDEYSTLGPKITIEVDGVEVISIPTSCTAEGPMRGSIYGDFKILYGTGIDGAVLCQDPKSTQVVAEPIKTPVSSPASTPTPTPTPGPSASAGTGSNPLASSCMPCGDNLVSRPWISCTCFDPGFSATIQVLVTEAVFLAHVQDFKGVLARALDLQPEQVIVLSFHGMDASHVAVTFTVVGLGPTTPKLAGYKLSEVAARLRANTYTLASPLFGPHALLEMTVEGVTRNYADKAYHAEGSPSRTIGIIAIVVIIAAVAVIIFVRLRRPGDSGGAYSRKMDSADFSTDDDIDDEEEDISADEAAGPPGAARGAPGGDVEMGGSKKGGGSNRGEAKAEAKPVGKAAGGSSKGGSSKGGQK
eukprot:jgi/Mesvir1/13303/Mv08593-RA.1